MKINEPQLGHRQRRARIARITAALLLAASTLTASHAAVVFDPLLAGQYAAGDGVNATFHRIDGGWTGTSVYWKEGSGSTPGVYSNSPGDGFQRIGTYAWGTGLWGLADWAAVNAPGSALPVRTWTGHVDTIAQGDREYAKAGYAATWGAVGGLPGELFAGSPGAQDNWTAYYSGYLRIVDSGLYNLAVLYDDGFFLRIYGADDSHLEISSDFLSPRDRLGFADALQLSTGLYRFELGSYDRLEAGVVDLVWLNRGEWVTVPREYLVSDPMPIPAPATATLLLIAIPLVIALRRRGKAR